LGRGYSLEFYENRAAISVVKYNSKANSFLGVVQGMIKSVEKTKFEKGCIACTGGLVFLRSCDAFTSYYMTL
jgi:hypothetical protein